MVSSLTPRSFRRPGNRKLLVNLLWFGQAIATAEALLIARRAGVDLDVVRHAPAELAALVEHTCQRALSRFGPVGGELLAVALLEEAGVGGPIMPCSAVARRGD